MSMPRYDSKFVFPTSGFPKTFKETVAEFKKNCAYIKANFELYPSMEICLLKRKNEELLMHLSNLAFWPF
jgi:hypothetical protein